MESLDSNIAEFIQRDQAQALGSAAQSIDDSPDDAVRALQLSKATGVDPSIIHGDLENFDRQNKIQVSTDIIRENDFLQEWLKRHPLNAKLANDDYGNLDEASQAMYGLSKQKGFLENTGDIVKDMIHSLAQAPEQLAGEAKPSDLEKQTLEASAKFGASPEQLRTIHERMQRGEALQTMIFGGPAFVAGGLVGVGPVAGAAITAGFAAALGAFRTYVSQPIEEQTSFPAGAIEQWAMVLLAGFGIKIAAGPKAVETAVKVGPYVEAGKAPPFGIDPAVDKMKKDQSAADLKDLMDALKASAKTATRERSADAYHDFAKDHLGDHSIGISADAVRELYGDKIPEPDDGLLGFVPRLQEKLAAAEASGGYVEIPTADFLARVEPEVAKGLEEHIRVRPEGVSKAEAKAMVEAYHGSPHEFDAFSMEKIGTGEGAQSYGHGLYFAENRGVATQYANTGGATFTFDDKTLRQLQDKYYEYSVDQRRALGRLADANGNVEAAKEALAQDSGPISKSAINLLDQWQKDGRIKPIAGNQYRVRIHANKEDFLDHDAVLGSNEVGKRVLERMDPAFKEQLESILEEHNQPELAELTGNEFRQLLERYASEDELPGVPTKEGSLNHREEASQYLKSLGIPGIKYLDQGSRGVIEKPWAVEQKSGDLSRRSTFRTEEEAQRHLESYTRAYPESAGEFSIKRLEGSHNFVLFDDSLIEITHKNDIAVETLRKAAGTETSSKAMAERTALARPERGYLHVTADGSELWVVPTEKMTAAERDIAALMKQTADRILGVDQVDVLPTTQIDFGGKGKEVVGINVNAEGMMPVVAYALQSDKAPRIVRHEAFHQLRAWGLIQPEEWAALKKAALTKNAEGKDWLDKHNVRERWKEHKLNENALIEEAFAEEFGEWGALHEKADAQIKSYGKLVDNVFEKVFQFFEQLYAKLEAYFGHPPEIKDLFEKIESGEVGKREREGAKEGAKVSAESQLKRKNVQELLKIANELGLSERDMYEFRGGPVRKEVLIANILAREEKLPPEAKAQEKQLELPQQGTTRIEDRAAFDAANAIGMTKDQYRRFMNLIQKQKAEDLEASAKRALEEQRKKQSIEWKKNAAELRPKVVDEINDRPEVMANKILGEKQAKIGAEFLTDEQKATLPKEYVAKDGVNPDDMATSLGFTSGDQMVQAVAAMEAQRKASGLNPTNFYRRMIDVETNRQMEAKYGKLGETILQEAKDQVLSETQFDLLHEETLAAATRAGAEFSITKDQLKRGAEGLFRQKEIKEVDSDKYIADSGRAGRGILEAASKQDHHEVFIQHERQYMAMLYSKLALELEKVKDKFAATAKRFSAREVPGIEQEYTDFIHDIFTRIGLPVRRSFQDIKENIARAGHTSLEDFVASKEAGLRELKVPDWLLDPDFRKDLGDLTVDEFMQLDDAIKSMIFNGRDEKKVLRQGAKEDLDKVIEDMSASLEDFDLKTYDISRKHPISDKVKSLWWSGITLESMFNRLDRGKPGLFFDTIVRQYNEAGIYKDRMMKDYQKKVAEVGKIPGIEKIVDNNLFVDPITGSPFTIRRRNVLGILQNVGNPQNLMKTAGGYKLEPQAVMDWLFKRTTKEDWDRAQKIGDIFEELFEKANTMSHEISGVGIERVPLEPIDTPFGSYRGWYNPLKYDPVRPGKSKALLGKSIEDEGFLNALKAMTPQGYAKGRTGYIAPVELNLDVVPQRMKQMIHDITMRPAILQLSKFFYNDKFERMITNRYGFHQAKEMIPFLRDIANQANFKSLAEHNGDSVVEGLRQNIIGVLIGLNPGTVMKHGTTALLNSMNEVGAVNWSREFMNIAKDLPSGQTSWKLAMEKSEELQRRMRNFSELIQGHGSEINIRGAQGNFNSFREFAVSAGATPVSISDLLSAVPTWLAKYKDELAKGSDEGQAVAMANRSVRLAHGSSNITNKPSIMRTGGPIKQTFTSLYGFFSHMLNKQYEMAWRAADAFGDVKEGNYAQAAKQLPRLANMFIAYVVLPAVIEELVTPYTNADRDSWGMKAAKTLGLGVSSSLIGVRDAIHALVNARDPQAGLIGTWMKAVTDIGRDVTSGKPVSGERAGRVINHATTAFGALTGLTNAQEGRMLEYMYRWHKGIERPKGPWDVAVGMRFGKTTGHSRSFEEWRKNTFGKH